MGFEIRFLTQDDLEQAFRLDQQAFNTPEERRDLYFKRALPERTHGAFANGRLVATTHIHAFGQFFGGRSVPMGGVGDVAVVPEHRGKGLARRVMTEAIQAMRARGEVISALFPATTTLYRGLGYELAGAAIWHQVAPGALHNLRGAATLETRRVEKGDDSKGIRRCYERVASGINGWLDRDDRRWQSLWEWWHTGHYLYACENSGGEVEAYLAYRHEPSLPAGPATTACGSSRSSRPRPRGSGRCGGRSPLPPRSSTPSPSPPRPKTRFC
jgi:predicted acetyltransferase